MLRKCRKFVAIVMACVALAICLPAFAAQGSVKNNSIDAEFAPFRRIIIDTDTAGDDAVAIMMALKAPNISVEGITVLCGNVELNQAVDNALMCVEVSGQTEVPVYKGSNTTYNGTERECFSVFGVDGMGDAGLIHPTIKAQSLPAVDYILNTVKNNPGEIDIVCLGPVTNIALAMDKDPETMKKVRSIIVMGTAGFGEGNATPVAEFNVYHDAVAFQRVLEADLPITIVGLDMCGKRNVTFDNTQVEEWKNSGKIKNFLATSWGKLIEFYANNKMPEVYICDAVAMYTVIYADAIADSVQCNAICITDSSPCYGQTVLYKQGFAYDSMPVFEDYPVKVVTKINNKFYHDRLNSLLK